jgi:KaiC/GvpD/RAD55 family RecA-like ATPase
MPPSKDANKSKPTDRLSSGIEDLDHILGGGFPAKRLFLVVGAPGSGKTTLALKFCWQARKIFGRDFMLRSRNLKMKFAR